MDDNPELRELVATLAMSHRELQRKSVIDPANAAETADAHHSTRRRIALQALATPGDARLVLMAAEMAQALDPTYADDDLGSALDLFRRAVAAIERIHAEHRREADSMLSRLLPPKG